MTDPKKISEASHPKKFLAIITQAAFDKTHKFSTKNDLYLVDGSHSEEQTHTLTL
jgi:hypothetical protein